MSVAVTRRQSREERLSPYLSSLLLIASCSCASWGGSHQPRSTELLGRDAKAVFDELGPPCEEAPRGREADVWWYYCGCAGSATASTNKSCGVSATTELGLDTSGLLCRMPNYFAPVCPDAKLVVHIGADGRVDAVSLPSAAPRSWMDVGRSARAD